jgi:alanyl aminopeptidase
VLGLGLGLGLAVACSSPPEVKQPIAKPRFSRGTATPIDAAVAAQAVRLPNDIVPLGYELRLELDPNSETFRGDVKIKIRIETPTDHVWIHADDLDITGATLDDAKIEALPPPGEQMRAFDLGKIVERGTATLGFAFSGHTTKDEQGLFRQRHGDRWYLFSQGEAVFARRITPCFDEPRFKVPWKVKLVVPEDQIALSNMASIRKKRPEPGDIEVEFGETPPMPSYLLAIAVGPFEIVDAGTVGRKNVPVHVAALRGDRGRVGVVAKRLPEIVDALENYLDEPLPWPKLDLVAVPHLFGAMENPGLVTFDTRILVGDDKRKGFAREFVHVAAHEVAHAWFGNLVTPAWWNDLWLSEAFASWLSDRVAVQLGVFEDPILRAALQRERALDADAAADARPLRLPADRNDDPDDAFDAIAYEKGSAILSTFEWWIGEDKLRAGLRAYLKDHRNATANADQLEAAIAAASTPAIAHAFRTYVDTPGTPIVELSVKCDADGTAIVARAKGGVVVPVCVRYGGATGPTRACALVGDRTEIAADRCPTWVFGNDGAAYYTVIGSLAPPPLAELQPAQRMAFGDDAASGVARGDLPIKAAVDRLAALNKLADPYSRHAAAAIAREIDPLVDDMSRRAWTSWLVAKFGDRLTTKTLLGATTPIDRQVREDLGALIPADLVPPATQKAARKALDAMLAKNTVDPQLVALAAPAGGAKLFDRLAKLGRTTKDNELKAAVFDALGTFGPEMIDRAIDLVGSDVPNEVAWSAVAGFFERPAMRVAAWNAVRTRLSELMTRMTGIEAGDIIEVTAALCDPALRADVAATFEPHLADISDGRRKLNRALAAIDHCVDRRPKATDIVDALVAVP